MKKRHLLLIGLTFFTCTLFSQSMSKGKFRQYYTQGNLMMMEGFYDTAVKTFLVLYQSDPSNANINYKIGKCYMNMSGQKPKAIPYLENAIKQSKGSFTEDDPAEKNAPEDAIYYLGQAYQYIYRFDDALVQFNKFRDMMGKWNLSYMKEIDHWKETTSNAKAFYAKPVNCTIVNIGDSINSEYADYSPVISADESILAFTSRRPGTGGVENKTIFDNYFEDIFSCTKGKYGTWRKAKSISRTINTEGNEATIGLSADGQQLYVYRDDNGDGNIYISKLDGEFWNAPYKMEAGNVNTANWEPSACISADGNVMYFVSNRPGGYGGRDIYVCYRLPNRSWTEPENMGPTINTPYEEDAPFIHPDGVSFFFSSTGHNSMGGFDIFQSTKVAKGIWTKPENLGFPINTTDDDIYFVVSSDGRRAYYSSFKPEGKGEKDIYMVSMNKPLVKSIAILAGWVKNKDGSAIPKYSSVNIKPQNGETISCKPNEATGKFMQSLLPGQEYEVTVEANNNKVFYDKFFLPSDSSYQVLGRAFFRQTIYLGDTVQLFSLHKVTDTASHVKSIPVDGKLLLSKNNNNPAKDATIQLLNANGDIMASTVTNKEGSFKFENIPNNQEYLIKIHEQDSILKTNKQFYIANKDGQVVSSSVNDENFFLFKNINADLTKMDAQLPASDAALSYSNMSGKLLSTDGKKPISNVNIALKDTEGKTISNITTDSTGGFSFDKVPSDNKYSIAVDNKSSTFPKNTKGFLLTNKDKEPLKYSSEISDYFVFENLPADLNTLGTLNTQDNSELPSMSGKLLKNINPEEGLANADVSLLDHKGNLVETTQTDNRGYFKFEKLSSKKNYSIQLNEKDTAVKSASTIFLANNADKIVKAINTRDGDLTFKKVPADLMKMTEIKQSLLTQLSKNNSSLQYTLTSPDDYKYDFVIYFAYNKKEIDIASSSFRNFKEKIEKIIDENGKVTIIIASSSSTVPTKKFASNDELASQRANEVKEKITSYLSSKKLNDSKINYEISTKVQGPAYNGDALKNKQEYEKWQFVKVIVKS